MRGPYTGELRVRVIRFVEGGGSRREAADEFDVSVSSAIRWVQRFLDDGTSEPMPRGGGTSPLEKHSERILALVCEHPDLILDEMVLALRKRRSPESESLVSHMLPPPRRHRQKKVCRRRSGSEPTWLGRADAGFASKACLTPPASYLSTKLQSRPTWCGPTVGTRAAALGRGCADGTLGDADIHRWSP